MTALGQTDELALPATRSRVAVWLGSAAPLRSVRWLDGAIRTAAGFAGAIAIAAGDAAWLDLAADRAKLFGVPCAGIPTDLALDYLGWAQIAAAAAKKLDALSLLVDEASRPDRFAEVAAIAELTGAAQLVHVVKLAPDGGAFIATRADAPDGGAFIATRAVGDRLETVRVRGPAVIGLRIADAPVDEYPTPRPAGDLQRLDLALLGLDANLLAHRAKPPHASGEPRRNVDRIAEHMSAFVRARTP